MSQSEKRALDGQVLVRLPAAVAFRIAGLAAAEGVTGASWSRRHLVAAADADPSDAVPRPARALPRPVAPTSVLELVRLREVVAELSGALVKAAILARTDAAAVLHAEVEAVLPGVRQAVRDLDRLKKDILTGTLPQ
jgi:hypothetical protein